MKLESITEILKPALFRAYNLKELRSILENDELSLKETGSSSFSLKFFDRKEKIQSKIKNDLLFFIVRFDGQELSQIVKKINTNYYLNDKNRELNTEIYCTQSKISNASTFIDEISAYHSKDTDLSIIRQINDICKERNIPFHVYKDKNDLYSDNRRNKFDITPKPPEETDPFILGIRSNNGKNKRSV